MAVAAEQQSRFVLPKRVSSHFHLREGDVVVDIGAGCGFFTQTLSERVGTEGVVYACEIQKGLVECIETLKQEHALQNVRPLWCDAEEVHGIDVPDGEADVVLIANTLFQAEDRTTVLQEAFRILRPGGKLFLIDWCESFGGLGPEERAIIREQTAIDAAESAEFVFERSFDAGAHHYGLAFRKP